MNDDNFGRSAPRVIRQVNQYFVVSVMMLVGFVGCLVLGALCTRQGAVTLAVPGRSVYLLGLSTHQTAGEAEFGVQAVQAKGGAGSVWEQEGVFHVIAAAYLTRADIDTVVAELGTAGNVLTLALPALQLTVTGDLQRAQRLHQHWDYLRRVLPARLYEVSVQLATGTSTVALAQHTLQLASAHLQDAIADIQALRALEPRAQLDDLASACTRANAILGEGSALVMPVRLRYILCQLAISLATGH